MKPLDFTRLSLLSVALSIPAIHAAEIVKADNGDALNLPASWVGGQVPGPSDIAIWNATVTSAHTPALGGTMEWSGIRILNPGAAVTIGTGGNGLLLGSEGIDMSAATRNLVTAPLWHDIQASQTWNVASGFNLRLARSATGAANADLDGGSAVVITLAGGGVVDANQGGGTGANDAAGFADYSGKWVVSNGTTLRGLRNGATAWGTNTAADAIRLQGGTLAVGGISGAQGNWTWATPIHLQESTASTISAQNPDAAARTLTLTAPVSGTGNLTFSRTQSGTHEFVLANLGTGAGVKANVVGTGQIAIDRVALVLQAGSSFSAMTHPNPFALNQGTLESNDAIQTFTGDISLSGANVIRGRWAGKNASLNGTLSGTGSVQFRTINQAGFTLFVNGNNSYTGGTIIGHETANSGIVVAGHANAFGSGALSCRGGQIQAGLPSLVIPNAVSVGAGGFRVGGSHDITFSGPVSIDTNGIRAFTHYGASTATLDGSVNLDAGTAARMRFEGGNWIVNGAVSGRGGVILGNASSTPTVVLNHTHTYTGPTQVTVGTLTVGGSITSPTTVSGSGRLHLAGTIHGNVDITGGSVSGTGSVTGNWIQSGGAIALEASAPGPAVSVGGTVSFSGPTTVRLEGPQPLGTTEYVVLNYGVSASGIGNLANGFRSSGFVDDTANKRITISITTAPRTWNAGVDNIWDSGTANWAEDDNRFFSGDSVTFGDTGAGTVQISGAVNPGDIVFTNSSGNDYLLTGGSIGGSGSLTVNGGGKAALATDVHLAGGFEIQNGSTLQVGSNGTTGSIGGGPVLNDGTLVFHRSDTITVPYAIGGTGDLVKSGAATLILTGSNDYSGTTTIDEGTLQVGSGGTSGTLGTGGIVNHGVLAFNRSDDLVIAADMSGTGVFTQQGGGVLSYDGIGTYGGGTLINGGTLAVTGTIDGTSAVSINGSTLVVRSGGSLTTTGSVNVGTNAGNRVVVEEDGAIHANAWNMPYNAANGFVVDGAIHVAAAFNSSTNATTTITGAGEINASEMNLFNYVNLVFDNSGSLNLAQHLTLGGPVTAAHAATFSLKQGTLHAAGVRLGWATPASTGAQTFTLDGGRANLGAGGIVSSGTGARNVHLGGGTLGATADWESELAMTLAHDGEGTIFDTLDALDGFTPRTITLNGVLSGTGGLVKNGDGTLVLNGPNTYTGTTTVNAGTLSLGSGGSLRFRPTSNGSSNKVTGPGSAAFSGVFFIDLAGAAVSNGNSWVLVDVAGANYEEGSFAVQSSAGNFISTAPGVHTLEDGGNVWTFTEATGALILESSTVDLYTTWSERIEDENQRERGHDPDRDGWTNLQEYLFGTDPSAGGESLVSPAREGSELVLRWLQLASGGSYDLQENAALAGPWSPSSVTPTVDPDQSDVPAGYVRMRAAAAIGGTRHFYRIEAEETP